MCPWQSHKVSQNLSFPGCTGKTVTRVCATTFPGNHVLGPQHSVVKSEASPLPMKSDFLGAGRASLCSQSPVQGARKRKLAEGACVKSWISCLGSPRSPLQTEGSLCTGTIICLWSRLRPHGSFRRRMLALCPLVFADEAAEAQRGSTHYSGSHSQVNNSACTLPG